MQFDQFLQMEHPVILVYPNDILRATAQPVDIFDNHLEQVVKKMFQVMYRSKGAGLAAPQVGLLWQIIIVNPTGDLKQPEREQVYVNPVLLQKSKRTSVKEEGCLSIPGTWIKVERPCTIKVQCQDIFGEIRTLGLAGPSARAVQHEMDHLVGKLILDHRSAE